MYVLDVLPLAKGLRAESLSYIASKEVQSGTLVTVPLRSRTVSAVVLSSTPASEMKAELKGLDYELKKIKSVGTQIFFEQFISSCEEFAQASGVSTGAALKALTPTRIVQNNSDLPTAAREPTRADITAPQAKVIQATNKKQLGYINSLISRKIGEEKSVFVVTPTTHTATQLVGKISTKATVVHLDNDLKKSMLLSRWREIASGGNPVVIVGTTQFLSVPRADLGLVIITKEASSSYKMIGRPHLDRRRFAEHFARSFKVDAILSDRALSTETTFYYKQGELGEAYKPVFRYSAPPTGELVDMKDIEASGGGVKIFSPKAAKLIRKASQGEKLLLFVARRGRRPFTVCNDCGDTLTCERCNYPLVLAGEGEAREFICRNCKRHYSSSQRCDNCGGWRLEALGVGIDFVAEILRENAQEIELFQVDGSSTKTDKQVNNELEKFRQAESGALLTTQLGVNRLDSNVDNALVVTADSLLALPDLYVSQKLFSLLLAIRERTEKSFIIQTRSRQRDIFSAAISGNTTSFYRTQIDQRKRFDYPPFSVLIKLSTSGKKTAVKKLMTHIRTLFSAESISVYPTNDTKQYGAIALLNIPRKRWVDTEVVSKLRSLPQQVDIDVHPQSLL